MPTETVENPQANGKPSKPTRQDLLALLPTIPTPPEYEGDGKGEGRTSMQDAIDLQRLVFKVSISGLVMPAELAHLARAWDILEARRRIQRGVAPLAPVKQEPKRRTQRQPQILPGTGPYVPPA